MELHWIRGEDRRVEHVQLEWQLVVAEVRPEEIARREERLPRAVARVAREALVVADHAPDLPALVVAAEAGAGRDADHAVKRDAVLHEHVEHAGREQPAHRSAFKNQSLFHGLE